ncbi:MAG TPA: acyltransferase, partial [Magnetovibrio sp.]
HIAKETLKYLQILRAVAVASVVYFHIGRAPVFGSFGVDIFFVISGFVMAMIVENGERPSAFAAYRIIRIVPLYWLLTTGLLVLAAIHPELLNSTTANFQNYLKSIFFIPYFKENGALHPMLAVGWTLNYEMFFYVCVWLSIIVSRKWFILISTALLLSSFLLLGNLSSSPVLQSFFGSTLVFEFVFGLFAFKIYQVGLLQKVGSLPLIGIACLSYIFMAYTEVVGTDIDRVVMYAIPSVALVLSVSALEKSIPSKSNSLINFFAAMGDASYATYLSHAFVVEGIRKIVFLQYNLIDPYTPFGVVVILSASLIVGQVLYVFLDKPLSNHFKKKFPAKTD